MTLTLNLQPEIERGLLAQAQAKGVSLTDYAQELLAMASVVKIAETPAPTTGPRTCTSFSRQSAAFLRMKRSICISAALLRPVFRVNFE